MKSIRMLAAALALSLVASAAAGQNWPDKPVHIVVPLTAGSATDAMARLIGQHLSDALGQPFLVENKPGAAGTIGTGAVARAKPDGYTILVQSASYTVTPVTYPNTPYNTQKDLAGVTPLALLPQALVVAPGRGINSTQELVARAKARPGAFSYASSGIGGLQTIYETSLVLKERGPRRVSPFFIPSALINLVSGQVSIEYGFRGPNHSVVTACATGAHCGSPCTGSTMRTRPFAGNVSTNCAEGTDTTRGPRSATTVVGAAGTQSKPMAETTSRPNAQRPASS